MCQTLNSSIKEVHYHILHTTPSPSRVTVFAYTRRKIKGKESSFVTPTQIHTPQATLSVCFGTNLCHTLFSVFLCLLLVLFPLNVLFKNGLPLLWA